MSGPVLLCYDGSDSAKHAGRPVVVVHGPPDVSG
jgi:hypothetical protein